MDFLFQKLSDKKPFYTRNAALESFRPHKDDIIQIPDEKQNYIIKQVHFRYDVGAIVFFVQQVEDNKL